jgi:hypothetical protein
MVGNETITYSGGPITDASSLEYSNNASPNRGSHNYGTYDNANTIDFYDSGHKLCLSHGGGRNEFYDLDIPYDITTKRLNYDYSIDEPILKWRAGDAYIPYGISYSSDGTKLYLTDRSNTRQYSLSTPFDKNTASEDFNNNSILTYGTTFKWASDGLSGIKIGPYFRVTSFLTSVPYDIADSNVSGATTQSFGPLIRNSNHNVSDDGKYLYMASYKDRPTFATIEMSTPWDITTAGGTIAELNTVEYCGGMNVSGDNYEHVHFKVHTATDNYSTTTYGQFKNGTTVSASTYTFPISIDWSDTGIGKSQRVFQPVDKKSTIVKLETYDGGTTWLGNVIGKNMI